MLVLSRKVNEAIIIGGSIRVTLTSVRGRQVRIAIEAPAEVGVYREELLPGPTPQDPCASAGADPPPPHPPETSMRGLSILRLMNLWPPTRTGGLTPGGEIVSDRRPGPDRSEAVRLSVVIPPEVASAPSDGSRRGRGSARPSVWYGDRWLAAIDRAIAEEAAPHRASQGADPRRRRGRRG